MEEKKYEILMEEEYTKILRNETVLHRIRALKDFDNVKKGAIGGYIESEKNLSQKGNCWLYDDACVYDNATVSDNARIYDNATIYSNAKIGNNARVYDSAHVNNNAIVYDNAVVCGKAKIHGSAKIFGTVKVYDNARVYNGTIIYGNAVLRSSANIRSSDDYLTIGPIGSRRSTTTFYKIVNNTIYVSCGCFNGSIDEFEEAVIKTHGDNKFAKEYRVAISLAKTYLNKNKEEIEIKMEEKKYEILADKEYTKTLKNGAILRKVKALKDFGNVKKGDIGGYIESERNLSQEGNCWVYDDASIYGVAAVSDNARIYDNAIVYDNAKIGNDACVSGSARVRNNAVVYDAAVVCGKAKISGNARICGYAGVYDKAKVYDNAYISGCTEIRCNARICKNVKLSGDSIIGKKAYIQSERDLLLIYSIKNQGDNIHFYKTYNDSIYVVYRNFNKSINKFKKFIIEKYGDNQFAKECLSDIAFARTRFDIDKGEN